MKKSSALINETPGLLRQGEAVLDIVTSGNYWRTNRLLEIRLIRAEAEGYEELQLLSEREEDEDSLLIELSTALEAVISLVTFNGTAFDLPMLHAKYKAFGLTDPLSGLTHRDLYLDYKDLKSILGLPGRHLKDYAVFLFNAEFDQPLPADDARTTLEILHLDAVCDFLDSRFRILDAGRGGGLLHYELAPDRLFPGSFSLHDACYHLIFDHDRIRLGIRLDEHDRLRVYHTDLKNYYYLPQEGYAVHASVAAYVDKTRKEKAVRTNCFHLIPYTDRLISDQKMSCSYLRTITDFLKTR